MSSSEERSLPASARKLDKARLKGDVAQPGDIVIASSLVASFMLIWGRPDLVLGGWSEVTVVALNSAHDPDFAATAKLMARMLTEQALRFIVPLIAVTVAVKLLVTIIVHKGPVFSFEPLSPKFERLNPGQNLKQIFSAQTATTLGKNIAKLIIIGSILVMVLLGSVGALVHTPACGLPCTVDALFMMARSVLIAALPVLLVLGLADVLIQRWLYLKRQRMTKTEAKRERLEQDGNPLFKRARRVAMALLMREAGFGLSKVTVVVAGGGVVLGFRYVIGETGLPILVWRPRHLSQAQAMAAAKAAGLHVEINPKLAASLDALLKIGSAILDEHFDGMAQAVRKAEEYKS